ncbi:uncharacterized protein EV420DRAFT_1571794 [Desarmillaria tabescens]|uniref:Uncharacterized protein n=1 Tax=Armillaria tabescens TaxID=1929756 RepID=A0AA39JMQ5_ARMTA|nr:uncharacterized protein EV420DRAFT_1571794 [Desarmillaria tabescens]KAK0445600.1 hypothetical protein EV420DRAFT_1571794 [Desarmillaria tabescens]
MQCLLLLLWTCRRVLMPLMNPKNGATFHPQLFQLIPWLLSSDSTKRVPVSSFFMAVESMTMPSLRILPSGSSFRYAVVYVLNNKSPCLKGIYQIFRGRLLDFLKGKRMPLSMDQQRALNENGDVQTIFEYYEAAGKKAGIPASDVGRQFEAEYGFNPLRWRTKEQNDPAWRKA